MSTPAKKHNCPLLKIFQGKEDSCGCGCGQGQPAKPQANASEAPASPEPAASVVAAAGDAQSAPEPSADVDVAAGESTALDSEEAIRSINEALRAFEENPAEFMGRLPAKQAEAGDEAAPAAAPSFDQVAIDGGDYVEAHDELRQHATSLDRIADGRAAFAANDRADGFVDSFRHSGLQSMESSGLRNARLSVVPWSDDYWAIYLGMLGKRYADPSFPNSPDWSRNYNYVRSQSAASILASGSSSAIDRLSPSEKYDILVGDKDFSLTKKMWEEGRKHYSSSGMVAAWMGLCHGWAPAAYMLPRPTGMARTLAADGRTSLTFYPADIKALATLLWAKASPKPLFIGGRCNERNPATDANGRIVSQKCFDTNPGTWHLAVVNQIGVSRRSMIIDATYDYEVWNQPLIGYSYRYFNPQSMQYVGSLAAATVHRDSFSNDKFARYRSGQADSFVGIAMDVTYAVETIPMHVAVDGPSRDRATKASYLYDLELDMAGRIIGGEWRSSRHPDFLWTPAKGARALTSWESQHGLSGTWLEGQTLPAQWRQVAEVTSEGAGAPLAAIVERLIQFANS